MQRCQPIGIFDSGVGGLTVAREVFRQMPGEEILYFADTAHVPYGPRPASELIRFALEITDFLVAEGAKLILVACNTSSSLALDIIRERHKVPVVGVVDPGAEEAVRLSRNGRIGVLATEATIRKGAHSRRVGELNSAMQVFGQACPRFVPLVESGRYSGDEARAASKQYLAPLIEAGVDTIVLGCTHYPFLEPVIREVIGEKITLIDPACQTVAQGKALMERGIIPFRDPRGPKPRHRFYVSGDPVSFARVGGALLGVPLDNDTRQVCLDGILEREWNQKVVFA
ncbi:glutamate racemase, putative [Heliomicrobium modesticaldum Ice1]|uniref:Glutamate racemase n=1 Tax=Heliobacterium modesticaldum (strain ATCC 51547 / Ice1) TaxID=498761 RepID=B0TFH8_HELMI|nr:glutamate racemase [Heliomicrobium modesticaldum]ABZ83077.1 glutamate racemase, putative [Heliomicrobium modesticaldum Ice1]